MIEIDKLTKRYGQFCAVNGLTLSIRPGEIFGFLGVNGAGKTTTLRMLAGVLTPTSGSIRICGLDLAEQPEMAKAMTGYIPDRPYIYAKLSGREFLYFVADLYNVSSAEAEERIESLLAEYQLNEWQDELVESYSHGMKQRLATCAALVHKPKVLIVDEPMVGLDPHGAKMLKEALKRYALQGMSILLSTHSLNVAEEVSDRLAIIHRGTVITTGTLQEIKHQSGNIEYDLEEIFLELTSQAIAQHNERLQ
ncbi:MAG: ABC transporter [Proteobacteria bacterium]|nr:MAG: ABC transporter [Pseudomonadota bacterium]